MNERIYSPRRPRLDMPPWRALGWLLLLCAGVSAWIGWGL